MPVGQCCEPAEAFVAVRNGGEALAGIARTLVRVAAAVDTSLTAAAAFAAAVNPSLTAAPAFAAAVKASLKAAPAFAVGPLYSAIALVVFEPPAAFPFHATLAFRSYGSAAAPFRLAAASVVAAVVTPFETDFAVALGLAYRMSAEIEFDPAFLRCLIEAGYFQIQQVVVMVNQHPSNNLLQRIFQ